MQKNNAFLIQEIQKAFLKDLRKSFYLKHKYLHKGLKITVSGRIRGSRRKRKLTLSLGRVTSSSLNKNLHSWKGVHHSLTGILGIKLYKS